MRKGCLFVESGAALGLQEKCGAKNQPGGPRTRMVKHESGGPLGAPGAQPGTSPGWQ